MKTLTLQESKVVQDAITLIQELEDEIKSGESPMGDDSAFPPPGGEDMPIEPPVSDTAVGASTEDNVALGLLREIRDLLAELVSDEDKEGEAPELPPEGAEPGAGEGEGEAGDEKDEFKPGKRPMPVPAEAE